MGLSVKIGRSVGWFVFIKVDVSVRVAWGFRVILFSVKVILMGGENY